MFLACQAHAQDVVRVAVVANFRPTFEELISLYAQTRPVRFVISDGTGQALYARIQSEASFDLFLSSDSGYPARLEREGAALPGTRRTYALAKLILWTPRRPVAEDLGKTLGSPHVRTIVLADPMTAPYGAAAEQVLTKLVLPNKPKLLRADDTGQAFAFLAAGRAEAGFITRAQLRYHERTAQRSLAGEVLAIEPDTPAALEQQLVLLKPAEGNVAARDFWAFIQSEPAQRLIAAAGYQSPVWIDPNCRGCKRDDSIDFR